MRYRNISFLNNLPRFLLFFTAAFLSKTSLAQEVADTPIEHNIGIADPKLYKPKVHKIYPPFTLTGRILGVNLESIKGAQAINLCTGETSKADDNGIYHINAAEGDTLTFVSSKYSITYIGVRSAKDKFNIILMKRKADQLPAGYTNSDYNKAKKEDDELYRILEKDAKLEGKWNY